MPAFPQRVPGCVCPSWRWMEVGGGRKLYTQYLVHQQSLFFQKVPWPACLPCVVIYLFFFSLPHPLFLSCWARIPGSLSLLGILEILGEEGREGWDVLEAGGREGGGHWEGQRSGQLHLARAARLSPGLRGRVHASARVALNRQHQGPGILATRGLHFSSCSLVGAVTFEVTGSST